VGDPSGCDQTSKSQHAQMRMADNPVGEVDEPDDSLAFHLQMTDAQMRRFDKARIDAHRGREGERAQLEKSAPG
jgi:hypothetical protein